MQILSALVLSALSIAVQAAPQVTAPSYTLTIIEPTIIEPTLTFTTRPTITPTAKPDACICPGKLLCCKALVDSEDPAAQDPLKELGVNIEGTHIPVGISCTPYNALTAACRQPVCCFDSTKPEIAAIGCVKVPTTVRPTLTTIIPTYTIPTLTVYPTLIDPTFSPVNPSLQPL